VPVGRPAVSLSPRPARKKRFIAGAGIGMAYQALVMIVGFGLRRFYYGDGPARFWFVAVGTQILVI